jgi:formylglycine-generating enzyme required for sulfatase activity
MEKPESIKQSQNLILIMMTLFLASLAGLWLWSNKTKQAPLGDMVWIPGGEFEMGTLNAGEKNSEESPAHVVIVKGFWMDTTEITNAQFSQFAEATGYVTDAEKDFSAKDYPNVPAEALKGGSMIFQLTPGVNPLQCGPGGPTPWWKFTPGATWRHPQGPESDIKNKMNYPVICITWKDAQAYAEWAGKRLPTEAEWEFAARGGLQNKKFVWGDEEKPDGKFMANYWQGSFPGKDNGEDGFASIAPVKSFPPNGYGLYDMSGNAWELCEDWYSPKFYDISPKDNPLGPAAGTYDPKSTGFTERVMRGGSWLCDDGYCFRYRPASRSGIDSISSTNHVGFRCVKDKAETVK